MPQHDTPEGTPLTIGDEPAYCPVCGAPVSPQLLEDDHRPRLVCPNAHVTWRNPRLVVGTLPVRAGRVFLARRSIEPGAGPTRHLDTDVEETQDELEELSVEHERYAELVRRFGPGVPRALGFH